MLTRAQYVYIMIYVEASKERNRMKKVNDVNGNEIDFYAAANLMDDEIVIQMEETSGMTGSDDDCQKYIEEYANRHAAKFDGEKFAPYYGLAW